MIGEDMTQCGDQPDDGIVVSEYRPTWDEMTREQKMQRLGQLRFEIQAIESSLQGHGVDTINPDHYKLGGLEVIDILRQKLTPEEFRGFCKGNLWKYTMRAESKGQLDDYKKAAWYASWLTGRDPR